MKEVVVSVRSTNALRFAARRMLRALDGYWASMDGSGLTEAWWRSFENWRGEVEQLADVIIDTRPTKRNAVERDPA